MHSDIRNVIFRVAIANVLEVELTIKSNEPASEVEKEFCERWVYVKVVFPCNIVGCKFPKLNFVKARMGDSETGG